MAKKWSNQNLPGALHFITGNVANRIPLFKRDVCCDAFFEGSLHQVWQESFKAVPLWSAWMIWQKINYIHANPVKAKLVASASEYAWSSFRAFYSDSDKPLKVDKDWWWPDDSEKLSKAMKDLGWRSYHKRCSSEK